jgi:hypothetical protein
MSVFFGHTAFVHVGYTLTDLETHTLRRRLPRPYPLSATWATYQTGTTTNDYQQCLVYGKDTAFDGTDYWNASILQDGGGTQKWSVGANGFDDPQDNVVPNRWYYQGFRAYRTATDTIHEYYYDLPDPTKVATIATGDTTYFGAPGTSHHFRVGDTAWAELEGLDGYMAGLKIWEAVMSPIEMWRECLSPWPQIPKYYHSLWDLLPLRTAYDRHPPGWKVKNQRRMSIIDITNPPTTISLQPDKWSRYGSVPTWQWSDHVGTAAAGGGGGGLAGPLAGGKLSRGGILLKGALVP